MYASIHQGGSEALIVPGQVLSTCQMGGCGNRAQSSSAAPEHFNTHDKPNNPSNMPVLQVSPSNPGLHPAGHVPLIKQR
jgi:hypothetical protein